MEIALTVNGLHVEAHYHDDEIEKVHKPLLQQLAKIHAAKPERRTIVFLSAPPGTGKSTLTTFWEYLSSGCWPAGNSNASHGWLSLL